MQFNFSGAKLPILLAAIAGVLMALQGSINAALGKVIGLAETTFVVHVIGALIVGLLLFGAKLGQGDLTLVTQAPWYAYLGGVISIFIIYLVAASIPVVGVSNATTAIIVGQVLTALVIDWLGLFNLEKLPFVWTQLIGLLCLAIGAKLLLRGT